MTLEGKGKCARIPTLIAASPVLAACAAVVPDRAAIDSGALGTRAAAEHQAVATEDMALAKQDADASVRHRTLAREGERTASLLNQGYAIRGHGSIAVTVR